MAVGKTNAQSAALQAHASTHAMTGNDPVTPAAIGTMRVYQKVSELGLTAGTATIMNVWDAMEEGSMALLYKNELASSEHPADSSYGGIYRIFKPKFASTSPEESGFVYFTFKINHREYKMPINASTAATNPNKPSGVWKSLTNVKVSFSSISSLPQTVNTGMAIYVTSTMEVLNATLSNPAAQTGSWTVTTAQGSVTISGNISGTTDVDLILGEV